jgi:hypothetical protein
MQEYENVFDGIKYIHISIRVPSAENVYIFIHWYTPAYNINGRRNIRFSYEWIMRTILK